MSWDWRDIADWLMSWPGWLFTAPAVVVSIGWWRGEMAWWKKVVLYPFVLAGLGAAVYLVLFLFVTVGQGSGESCTFLWGCA